MFAGAWSGELTVFRYVEPAVNRQPGFRRELVEQNQSFTFSPSEIFIRGHSTNDFLMEINFLRFFKKIQFFHIFRHFGNQTPGLIIKVRSSSEADIHTK